MDKVFDKEYVAKLKKVEDYDALFSYCQEFSTSNDWEAICELAECFYYGYGVEQSYFKAAEWYTKAAEQGNIDAQFNLSRCYIFGYGVESNYYEAYRLLESGAYQGDAKSQFLLAFMYKNGDIIEQNCSLAVKWYTKAAEQGHADAQFCLAECYREGCGVEQSNSEAAKWYTKAVEWYTKAAKQGNIHAECSLALCYKYGYGVERSYSNAVEWFTKAAEQGYAEAQFNLAGCYLNGNGVKQNYSKAHEWYKKSAEQDYAKAQYNLALCYEKGYGVEPNISVATEWYTKAAEHGIKDAKQALKRINRLKLFKGKFFLRQNDARQAVPLSEMDTTIRQLMTTITELKQDNNIISSDIQKIKLTQTNIISGVNSIDRKIDHLINFVQNFLPDELEKQRRILSSELRGINSSIEQNEETVAEWNRKMDEYICDNIHKYGETNEIKNAKNDLCIVFGKVWYKLDDEVRTSLVSSRVMWLKCKEFSGSFDYSGVCITATAALESLLTKVFLKNFQDYLNNKNIPFRNWPSTLVYNDHGNLTQNKFFTLGNLKYLLGDSDEWSDETKWTENRKKSLENYLNSIIKKDENCNDPRDVFIKKKYNGKSFLERCEDIRIKYRNEAAHTNCVDKQTAEQCYDEIIGVREHLENINNIILILFDLLKEENI